MAARKQNTQTTGGRFTVEAAAAFVGTVLAVAAIAFSFYGRFVAIETDTKAIKKDVAELSENSKETNEAVARLQAIFDPQFKVTAKKQD